MTPADWLDRTALFRGEREIAEYGAFARSAHALASALRGRFGIAPGDRVALFAKNCPQYLIVMYGAWIAGAVVVPINNKLHPREASWIMEDAGARIAFVTADPGDPLRGIAPDSLTEIVDVDSPAFDALTRGEPMAAVPRGAEDLAWLFYTSGTTGRPKGVMMPNRALATMALSYFADADEVYPRDAAYYAAPMSHGAGIYNFMHVIRGARHVVPESGGFDPAEILDAAPRIGDLHMFAAPTMVKRLVDAAKAGGSRGEGIRTIVYGGGPMYRADIEEAVAVMGDRFVQIYGQGECPMAITALPRALVSDRTHPRWRERLASVGQAQSGVRVAILGEDGAARPPGEIGEIAVQGPALMLGYWNNPEATAKTIRDGWLWTGDMGSMDEDGFVTMHDRSRDMIISGGSNIYPREVEEVLLTHPDVSEVAVVGQGDAEWGEIVVAFVVPIAGRALDPSALDRLCVETIARFKRPKVYRFVDELPKNNYGKVLKTELRKMLEER
ncbi:MAG: class I adenylate-forming enzyme family protein [Rubricella sp.]